LVGAPAGLVLASRKNGGGAAEGSRRYKIAP